MRRRRGQSTLLLLAGVSALVYLAASPAYGGSGVGVSVNVVSQAVKSVTVTPGSTSYTGCAGGSSTSTQLGFPNGECTGAQSVSIVNGSSPATILVNGADMVPADNGPHWTLCVWGASPQTCTGPQSISQMFYPGTDQYYETVSPSGGYNLPVLQGVGQVGPGPFDGLTNTPSCDTAFNGASGCSVGAGKSSLEFLAITGPNASSDPSTSFSTAVTYTAS